MDDDVERCTTCGIPLSVIGEVGRCGFQNRGVDEYCAWRDLFAIFARPIRVEPDLLCRCHEQRAELKRQLRDLQRRYDELTEAVRGLLRKYS